MRKAVLLFVWALDVSFYLLACAAPAVSVVSPMRILWYNCKSFLWYTAVIGLFASRCPPLYRCHCMILYTPHFQMLPILQRVPAIRMCDIRKNFVFSNSIDPPLIPRACCFSRATTNFQTPVFAVGRSVVVSSTSIRLSSIGLGSI